MDESGEGRERHPIASYLTGAAVWAALIALTVMTLTLPMMLGGRAGELLPFLISTVKAGLVVYFFMQLRFETGVIRLLLAIEVALVAVVASLVFSDILYR